MVKGVNKTVIEINETGNDLFEKIILYVSPNYTKSSSDRLKREAVSLAESFSSEPAYKRSLRKIVAQQKRRRRNLIIAAALMLTLVAVGIFLTV